MITPAFQAEDPKPLEQNQCEPPTCLRVNDKILPLTIPGLATAFKDGTVEVFQARQVCNHRFCSANVSISSPRN